MNSRNFFLSLLFFLSCSEGVAERQSLQPEIRVCSQNLFNYGLGPRRQKKAHYTPSRKEQRQGQQLVNRFAEAGCDVVALQEIIGHSDAEAEKSLKALAIAFSKRLEEDVSYILGDTNDRRIRNGFLYRPKTAKLLSTENFDDQSLPLLKVASRTSYFSRGPVGALFEVKTLGAEGSKKVYILSYHLKSKANAHRDPSSSQFEIFRMEMAEGLRRLFERKRRQLGKDVVVVFMGDRNSDPNSASADILSGERWLEDFRQGGGCGLAKNLSSQCALGATTRSSGLYPVMEMGAKRFPDTVRSGSYLYKKKVRLIDEVYLHPEESWMIHDRRGLPRYGLLGRFYKGSDHLLLWLELNW